MILGGPLPVRSQMPGRHKKIATLSERSQARCAETARPDCGQFACPQHQPGAYALVLARHRSDQ